MRMIYIRFKTIGTFGLALLCVSFIWFAMTSFQREKQAVTQEAVTQEVVTVEDPLPVTETTTDSKQDSQEDEVTMLPTITIVPQEGKEVKDNFFSEYRLERDRTRSEQVEILNEVINNSNTAAQTRLNAQQKLLLLTDNLGKESKIENALIAKGFPDAAAVIQPHSVMVIVPTKGLRQDEIARIADIVTKIAECKIEDVVIVPKTQ